MHARRKSYLHNDSNDKTSDRQTIKILHDWSVLKWPYTDRPNPFFSYCMNQYIARNSISNVRQRGHSMYFEVIWPGRSIKSNCQNYTSGMKMNRWYSKSSLCGYRFSSKIIIPVMLRNAGIKWIFPLETANSPLQLLQRRITATFRTKLYRECSS